jgi:hypothetical protein
LKQKVRLFFCIYLHNKNDATNMRGRWLQNNRAPTSKLSQFNNFDIFLKRLLIKAVIKRTPEAYISIKVLNALCRPQIRSAYISYVVSPLFGYVSEFCFSYQTDYIASLISCIHACMYICV